MLICVVNGNSLTAWPVITDLIWP